MPCRTNGMPPPKVTWEKDGREVSLFDSNYRILRSGWLAIYVARLVFLSNFSCQNIRLMPLSDVVMLYPPNTE